MSNESMSAEQFCYWLNGHFDLSELDALTEKQVIVIKQHLALVFDKKADSVYDISLFKDIPKTSKSYPSFFPSIDTKPVC